MINMNFTCELLVADSFELRGPDSRDILTPLGRESNNAPSTPRGVVLPDCFCKIIEKSTYIYRSMAFLNSYLFIFLRLHLPQPNCTMKTKNELPWQGEKQMGHKWNCVRTAGEPWEPREEG